MPHRVPRTGTHLTSPHRAHEQTCLDNTTGSFAHPTYHLFAHTSYPPLHTEHFDWIVIYGTLSTLFCRAGTTWRLAMGLIFPFETPPYTSFVYPVDQPRTCHLRWRADRCLEYLMLCRPILLKCKNAGWSSDLTFLRLFNNLSHATVIPTSRLPDRSYHSCSVTPLNSLHALEAGRISSEILRYSANDRAALLFDITPSQLYLLNVVPSLMWRSPMPFFHEPIQGVQIILTRIFDFGDDPTLSVSAPIWHSLTISIPL